MIDKLLASEKLPKEVDVQVGTIHGFQGDECDIIFAVFNTPPTISASKDMFLNKRNIINVSISRARDYLFIVMPDDNTENINNLRLVRRVEQLTHDTDAWNEFLSPDLEDLMFGDPMYLENNAFSTGHQSVNVYGLPEKRYEVRVEDNAIDVQIHKSAAISLDRVESASATNGDVLFEESTGRSSLPDKQSKHNIIVGVLENSTINTPDVNDDTSEMQRVDRQTLDSIQKTEIDRHGIAFQDTQSFLTALGKVEKSVIDSFENLSDTMQRIQGRPQIKPNIYSAVKLPNYGPDEIKNLSAEVRKEIKWNDSSDPVKLAGLAAFGAGAFVHNTVPTTTESGLIFCMKSVGLEKMVVEDMLQVKRMVEIVDEIVNYYARLRNATASLSSILTSVYERYNECLQHTEETLSRKTVWGQFSRQEKQNVQNTILLAVLLYKITQTNILIRRETGDALETVNERWPPQRRINGTQVFRC